MEWRRKSDVDEMYCAVHNADCELQSHSGDPMVLCVNPSKIPSAWICPQAVIEMEYHLDEAHNYRDENDREPSGVQMSTEDEETVYEALALQGYNDIADAVGWNGVESLPLEEIDACIYALEEQQDELPDEAERIHSQLIEAWEEGASEDYHG